MSEIAVVTLAVLSCVNLVLLLGVVRKLNKMNGSAAAPAKKELPAPRPGTAVGDFTAVTADGEPFGTKDLIGWRLVGFFTVGCPLCDAFKPDFRANAAAFPGGRDQVLAIVAGGKGDPKALAAEFADVAHVIVERPAGPVGTAFGVTSYPMACLLKANTVAKAGLDIDSFASTAEVPRRNGVLG